MKLLFDGVNKNNYLCNRLSQFIGTGRVKTLMERGRVNHLLRSVSKGVYERYHSVLRTLTFSVDGTDKTATTIANVKQKGNETVAIPIASIASGTLVVKGTAVTLTCATEGATIYYTTDGSCPCDETGSRKVYDGTPIVIDGTVTIKVMAVAPDMYESDVAEFTYIVNDDSGIEEVTINGNVQIYPLPVRDKLNIEAGGKIITGVTVTSTNGTQMAMSKAAFKKVTLDVSSLPAGIYIVNVATQEGVYSRKVLKVK